MTTQIPSRFRAYRFVLVLLLILTTRSSAGEQASERQRNSNVQVADKIRLTELATFNGPWISLDAAIADGHLYLWLGLPDSPRVSPANELMNRLLRLDLSKPDTWKNVADAPHRAGFKLTAYRDKIYRVGGWEAPKSGGGWERELYSVTDFSRFDPQRSAWQKLTSLPRGRSSHNAVILGDQLFVVGGWEMRGQREHEYFETVSACDLSHDTPQWSEITRQPFRRRSVGAAAFNGKLYVIGGMGSDRETTTAVEIYDPKTRQWNDGPDVPGKSVDCFDISAIGTEKGLFACTRSGVLYRLAPKTWEQIGKLNHTPLSRRLLATADGRLVLVSGESDRGKVERIDFIDP
jgi:N-acetylneuraminic acid mutarotase